ncbi:MAG: hypothetical protein MUO58_21130 [Anaerolineales bacterium]|nr:hypothetical protein [Anaerolineales bacterium]
MKTKIINIFNRIDRETLLVILILLVNLVLVSPDLLPEFQEINHFDETKYIDSGRSLVDGQLRELARGPLVALVYAPLYLITKNSPNWFLLSAGIGRILLFTLIWLTTFQLSKQFKRFFHPLVAVGLLFISTALIKILSNPSDALFTSMSALALAFTVSFYQSNRIRNLSLASVFIGLAALSRPDGLFLFPFFIAISLWLGLRKSSLLRIIVRTVLPGLAIITLFVIVRGLSTGDYSLHVGNKGYNTLLWSQHTVSGGQLGEGYAEAEALYGTAAENQGSVLQAILHNPTEFSKRIYHNLKQIPQVLLSAYGKRIGPTMFLIATIGIYGLLKKRAYALLAILLLWPAYGLLYLGFYLRDGFLLLSHFILIVLGGIGLNYIISPDLRAKERILWSIPLVALSIYSILDNKPAFLAVGVITLATLLIIWLVYSIMPKTPWRNVVGLLIALSAGLLLHDHYPFPNPWNIGESAGERAVHFLQDNLPSGTPLAAPDPLPAVASNMTFVYLTGLPDGESTETFQAWIDQNGVKALYITPGFIKSYPEKWDNIETSIGDIVEVAFIGDPGSIQVLMVQPQGN